MRLGLPALLAFAAMAQAPEPPPARDPVPPSEEAPAAEAAAPYGTADPALDEEVEAVARRVELVRGRRFRTIPAAVRASPEAHRALLAGEAEGLPPERLAARGRAWADLGLGEGGAPAALAARLRDDVDGLSVDAAGRVVRAEPWVLPPEDLAPTEEGESGGAAMLLATGVRPDGPALAHALTHALARQGESPGRAADTTDAMLARRAWQEGEADLVAVRYLFETMGLEDEILAHDVDLGELAGGRLLPSSIASSPEVEQAFLSFVHEEGFARASALHRKRGWAGIASAHTSRTTTRDVLHADRAVPPARSEGPEPLAPPGMREADRDRLGELGVVVLVSTLTGKDNLALLAGEGWAGDDLHRYEPAGGPAEPGVSLWTTRWTTPTEAAEFDDALGRGLEVRHGTALVPQKGAPGRRTLRTPGRVVRLALQGDTVTVRVAPPDVDAALERGNVPGASPPPHR